MKSIFTLLLFLLSFVSFAQYNYSYTDPCSGRIRSITVQPGQPITVNYYGNVNTFSGNDFNNGVFQNWINGLNTSNSPCDQVATVLTNNVNMIITQNIISITNNISSILIDLSASSISDTLGNIVTNGEDSSTEDEKDSKKSTKVVNNPSSSNSNETNSSSSSSVSNVSSNNSTGSNSGSVVNSSNSSSSNTSNNTNSSNTSVNSSSSNSSNVNTSVGTNSNLSSNTSSSASNSTNSSNSVASNSNNTNSSSISKSNDSGSNSQSSSNSLNINGASTGVGSNSQSSVSNNTSNSNLSNTNQSGVSNSSSNNSTGVSSSNTNQSGVSNSSSNNSTGVSSSSNSSGASNNSSSNSSSSSNTNQSGVSNNSTNSNQAGSSNVNTGSSNSSNSLNNVATSQNSSDNTQNAIGQSTALSLSNAEENTSGDGKSDKKTGSMIAAGDIVALKSAEDPTSKEQIRVTASITKANTDNTRVKGVLGNFTTVLNNTNISLYKAWVMKKKKITIIAANSSMINFDRDFFNTTTVVASKRYKGNWKKLTTMGGINFTLGNYGDTKFQNLSAIGGGFYSFNVSKKVSGSVLCLAVYSPFTMFFDGRWWESSTLIVPYSSWDYKITKTFKFNLSMSSVYELNRNVLNYQILMGGKILF